jgi:hypothetical protein
MLPGAETMEHLHWRGEGSRVFSIVRNRRMIAIALGAVLAGCARGSTTIPIPTPLPISTPLLSQLPAGSTVSIAGVGDGLTQGSQSDGTLRLRVAMRTTSSVVVRRLNLTSFVVPSRGLSDLRGCELRYGGPRLAFIRGDLSSGVPHFVVGRKDVDVSIYDRLAVVGNLD